MNVYGRKSRLYIVNSSFFLQQRLLSSCMGTQGGSGGRERVTSRRGGRRLVIDKRVRGINDSAIRSS